MGIEIHQGLTRYGLYDTGGGEGVGGVCESRVENEDWRSHFLTMSMTVEQIVREVCHLPREQAAELFDRLLVETVAKPESELDAAWKREISRRIGEIESGREIGVDGDEVMAELRQIVGR